MNLKQPTASLSHVVLSCIALCAALTMSGCHKAPATAAAPAAEEAGGKEKPGAAEESEGVSLKPEEVQKMGIVTAEAKTIVHAPEATGFAVVLTHEGFATAV